jgi:hypothetical protein
MRSITEALILANEQRIARIRETLNSRPWHPDDPGWRKLEDELNAEEQNLRDRIAFYRDNRDHIEEKS